MTTLNKFKFLATQCVVIGSPARSPTTSPVIHIRRRKTLRMLLSRRFHHQHNRRDHSPDRVIIAGKTTVNEEEAVSNNLNVRSKLKDLFISNSQPSIEVKEVTENNEVKQPLLSGGLTVVKTVGGMKPLSATLRQRLLFRRVWRPVLVAIPEQSP